MEGNLIIKYLVLNLWPQDKYHDALTVIMLWMIERISGLVPKPNLEEMLNDLIAFQFEEEEWILNPPDGWQVLKVEWCFKSINIYQGHTFSHSLTEYTIQ